MRNKIKWSQSQDLKKMNHYSAIATDCMHSISMCTNANKAHHAKHNYANCL